MTAFEVAIVLYGFSSFLCGICVGYLMPKKTADTVRKNYKPLRDGWNTSTTTKTVTFNEPSDVQETFDKIDDLDDVKANFEQHGT